MTSRYGEAHLQIAQAVALKLTGATSWNELWWQRVGRLAGLPHAMYWDFPSPDHPDGGAGMSISSVGYAKFLSAFEQSLRSKARPTQPLKIGAGIGHGANFWGLGHAMHPVQPIEGTTYAYTSWRSLVSERAARGDTSLVHSIGCRGWLPGVFPATEADGPGWWMQMSREGSMGFCLGGARSALAVEGRNDTDGLVDTIIEAVKEHRNSSAAPPFEVSHTGVACRRKGIAAQICKCESMDISSCGQISSACSTGELGSSACAEPLSYDSKVWARELRALCARCEGDQAGTTTAAFMAPTPAPTAIPTAAPILTTTTTKPVEPCAHGNLLWRLFCRLTRRDS